MCFDGGCRNVNVGVWPGVHKSIKDAQCNVALCEFYCGPEPSTKMLHKSF